MQDGEVVAAIVAGDPHGFAEAYDRYAAPLYTYCSFMLPTPDDAAGAVRDTFLIASSRLERLRDPGRLRPWLHAVARNECLRRLSTAGVTPPPQKNPGDGAPPPAAPRPPRKKPPGDGPLPRAALPAWLRGEVLRACADNTPAGRADRASVAHHAGTFGPAGFPKAIGSPAPQWWRRLRRHPRAAAAAAVATVATVAVAGGLLTMLTVGGPHRAQASAAVNGGGLAGGPGGGSSMGPPAAPPAPGPADAIGHRTGGHNQPGLPGEPGEDAYALGFAVRDVRVAVPVPVTLRLPVPAASAPGRGAHPRPGLPRAPGEAASALGFAVRDVRVAVPVPVTLRLPVPVCLPVNRAGRPGGDAGRAGAHLHPR